MHGSEGGSRLGKWFFGEIVQKATFSTQLARFPAKHGMK